MKRKTFLIVLASLWVVIVISSCDKDESNGNDNNANQSSTSATLSGRKYATTVQGGSNVGFYIITFSASTYSMTRMYNSGQTTVNYASGSYTYTPPSISMNVNGYTQTGTVSDSRITFNNWWPFDRYSGY